MRNDMKYEAARFKTPAEIRIWTVYGEIVLAGIKAETREQAIQTAREICSDDQVQADSFFDAKEKRPAGSSGAI